MAGAKKGRPQGRRADTARELAGIATDKGGVIYFIVSTYNDEGTNIDAVKIGYSSSLDRVDYRVHNLQCGNPNPVRLVALVAGDEAEEHALHARLYAEHGCWLRGEWYRLARARKLVAALR